MDGLTLIVVPTCGNEWLLSEKLVPTKVGRMRLNKATELLKENPNSSLAIVGGMRTDPKTSEATCAANWFRVAHTKQAHRLALYRAQSKYTAGDMVDLAEHIPAGVCEICLVTHPDHGLMAACTLRACKVDVPIRVIESGELAPYGKPMLRILHWVYKHDPKWERWHSWPLRVMANRRDNPTAESN